MSEFELIEAWGIATAGLGNAGMNIITVVFAYVFAAHLAGKNLSRAAVISVSTIYSLWLVGPFVGFMNYLNLSNSTTIKYFTLYPDGSSLPAPGNYAIMMVLSAGPYALGWIGSLIFMHAYIRNNISSAPSTDA